MNAKFIRMRATAARLIKENGAKTQVKRANENIDPVTGLPDGPEELVQDAFIVFLPAGTSGDAQLDQFRDSDGVLDLEKLKKVLISTEGLKWEPGAGDLVLYRGDWWNFYGAGKIDPDAETDIVYKGYIRSV